MMRTILQIKEEHAIDWILPCTGYEDLAVGLETIRNGEIL